MRDREKVLDKRRSTLRKPPSQSIAFWEHRAILEYQSSEGQVAPTSRAAPLDGDDTEALAFTREGEDDGDDDDAKILKILGGPANIRKICSHLDCLAAKMKRGPGNEASNIKMRRCSRCTVATYCSVGTNLVET